MLSTFFPPQSFKHEFKINIQTRTRNIGSTLYFCERNTKLWTVLYNIFGVIHNWIPSNQSRKMNTSETFPPVVRKRMEVELLAYMEGLSTAITKTTSFDKYEKTIAMYERNLVSNHPIKVGQWIPVNKFPPIVRKRMEVELLVYMDGLSTVITKMTSFVK